MQDKHEGVSLWSLHLETFVHNSTAQVQQAYMVFVGVAYYSLSEIIIIHNHRDRKKARA